MSILLEVIFLSIKANDGIRRTARAAGIPYWRIALTIGVSEPTLIRWLRVPLTEDKEKRIMAAIAELAKEAG